MNWPPQAIRINIFRSFNPTFLWDPDAYSRLVATGSLTDPPSQ